MVLSGNRGCGGERGFALWEPCCLLRKESVQGHGSVYVAVAALLDRSICPRTRLILAHQTYIHALCPHARCFCLLPRSRARSPLTHGRCPRHTITAVHTTRQEETSGMVSGSQAALTGHQEESVAAAAAKALAAKMPGSMAVRAYLQLPSLKKAPPEVGRLVGGWGGSAVECVSSHVGATVIHRRVRRQWREGVAVSESILLELPTLRGRFSEWPRRDVHHMTSSPTCALVLHVRDIAP